MKTKTAVLNGKKLVVGAVALVAAIGAFAEADAFDYRSWILANGAAPVCAGGVSGSAYPASYGPANAFDGSATADANKRYLGEVKNGACLIYGADVPGQTFPMSAYRVCQLTAGDYANDRAPTAWTLSGGDTSEGPWTEIETRSGVTWSGMLGQKAAVPAIDDCWRMFKLETPQTYKFYRIDFTDSRVTTAVTWDVGVMEVEYLGNLVDGSVTFVPPHAEEKVLTNSSAYVTTTYDESAYPVDADNAISFLGFDAVGYSTTVFKGGWWDFGLGGFFRSDSSFGGRTTVFDGSVVTNAGSLYLAGTSGDNNKLLLKGTSELHLDNFVLGMKNGNGQNSRALVTDGSLLHCTGYISFNDRVLSASTYLSGNELVISNVGSRLVVDGSTYLDRTQAGAAGNYYAGVGGNALVVTDHASAKLHALNVAISGFHSMSNRVTVSKGGYLETTSINLGSSWASGANTYDYTRFEVLDGGVVTNTGLLTIGYYDGSKHGRISVVVSNGVLYSATKHEVNQPIIGVKESKIVISGPNARYFNGSNSASVRLFGPGAVDSRFIVENGAVVTSLPVNYGYTYMANTTRASLIVRNGGVLSIGDIRMASYNGSGTCVGNSFVAGSGASVTTGQFWCDCLHGTVTVDNAVLYCKNTHYYNAYGAINIGGGAASEQYQKGTNCVLNVKGHAPKIIALSNRIQIDRASKVVFHLPSDGYAPSAQPLVDNGGQQTRFGDDCALEFAGAEDLFAYHENVLKKWGKYTLMRANSFAISDDILAAANASLPEGMEVKIEDGADASGNKRKVMTLSVKPRFGLMLIVR